MASKKLEPSQSSSARTETPVAAVARPGVQSCELAGVRVRTDFEREPRRAMITSSLRIRWVVSAIVLALLCRAACAVEVHVSPTGNDAHPGTPQQPFATLERARDEVRKLQQSAPAAEPIVVLIHAGTYRIAKSLAFGPADSGTRDAGILWQAVPGNEVRLSGGASLAGDAFEPVRDDPTLMRLKPAARDQIRVLDLHSAGVDELGNYPDSFRGAPAVPELFFNDQRMMPARWPNEGWATIAKIVASGAVPREGVASSDPPTFEYSGDEPARWKVDAGVWLLGYWCYDWFEETIRVQSIDIEKRQIALARPTLYGIAPGNPSPRRYRALNLLEELDEAGEYYLDFAARRLYFWPPGELRDARIVLSTLNSPIVALKDTSYLTLRGFILEASLGEGLNIAGGENNSIEYCEVRNVRQLGISVAEGSHHRVEWCRIHDTGTGGLQLAGGDRRTLTPAGHTALNNEIWRFSQHQLSYACGITLAGVGNRAAHNLLYDAPHIAIGISGNDHIFEYNIVRDVCNASDDAGALYKGRNPSCRHNMIRYNLWQDIGSPMGHGTAAVYFDDGDGGDTVFGNIFVRCGYPGRGSFGTIFSHGGHDNWAENNLFVDCRRALGSAPWDDARWQDALNGGQGCEWKTRLLQEVDVTQPPYTTRYPELVGFLTPQPGQKRVNHAKNNVLVDCEQAASGNWEFADNEMWITDSDPGFVDAAAGNYSLRADSPVYRHLPGFKPIPFDQIGPQRKTTDEHP